MERPDTQATVGLVAYRCPSRGISPYRCRPDDEVFEDTEAGCRVMISGSKAYVLVRVVVLGLGAAERSLARSDRDDDGGG